MSNNQPLTHSLIDVADSVLIVIDVQDFFLGNCDKIAGQKLVDNNEYIIRLANKLDIPVIVTVEAAHKFGNIPEQLAKHLKSDVLIQDKLIFGVAGNPEIMETVKQTGRKTAILTGLDSDVCVAHSALGLLQEGYKVAVVEDAVLAPGTGHRLGLQRINNAGGVVIGMRALFFEFQRGIEKCWPYMEPDADLPLVGW
jgi:nicotinamidase-related amidase